MPFKIIKQELTNNVHQEMTMDIPQNEVVDALDAVQKQNLAALALLRQVDRNWTIKALFNTAADAAPLQLRSDLGAYDHFEKTTDLVRATHIKTFVEETLKKDADAILLSRQKTGRFETEIIQFKPQRALLNFKIT